MASKSSNRLSQVPFISLICLSLISDESFIMFGLNECCKEFGGPMWDRLSSLRYCSDTGGIFTKGVGVRSDYPYGKGKRGHFSYLVVLFCLIEKLNPNV